MTEPENEFKEQQDRIRTLLREKNGILLAHNYMRDEIQEIADFQGDSLYLCQKAAETDADIIVFCGVHFMAESAAVLCPDKKVLLPNMQAGCPMADMITGDQLRKKKPELDGIPIVAYVNTTADVKAESDICCTSANVVRVVDSVSNGKGVFMVPDMNLAQFAQTQTDTKIDYWKGFCPTHQLLQAEDVLAMKETHPRALFMAHPECRPEVLELADHICSTSGMYTYARGSDRDEFIVATEMGILYRLRKENPGKKFHLASHDLICPNMKVNTLDDVIEVLTEENHVITVPEEIRVRAKRALDRMLAIPRD
jgi:quinolinate synthase